MGCRFRQWPSDCSGPGDRGWLVHPARSRAFGWPSERTPSMWVRTGNCEEGEATAIACRRRSATPQANAAHETPERPEKDPLNSTCPPFPALFWRAVQRPQPGQEILAKGIKARVACTCPHMEDKIDRRNGPSKAVSPVDLAQAPTNCVSRHCVSDLSGRGNPHTWVSHIIRQEMQAEILPMDTPSLPVAKLKLHPMAQFLVHPESLV